MGRSTKAKLDKHERTELDFRAALSQDAKKSALRSAEAQNSDDQKLLSMVSPFLDRAWRGLDTFKPRTRSARVEKRALDMARHLFGKHAIPPILWQAWEREGSNSGIDARAWFVGVGVGSSFIKTCSKGIFTRREAHLFLTCPHPLSFEQALHWAVARAQGASDGLALRICRSKASSFPFNHFWRSATRFFSEHAPASTREASDLCDYLAWRLRDEPRFEIFGHGHTADSLRARMLEWHRDLARAKALGDERWTGSPEPDSEYRAQDSSGAPVFWSVRQIIDSKSLAAEGNAMRHCVLSYKYACVEGRCSIWSIQSGLSPEMLERKLTVEVDKLGSIVQARGLANREARPAERHILRLWARERGFVL